MKMRCYLAMTGAEFSAASALPKHVAWMACHFSSYGTGLSNLPTALPEGSVIIVNDRTPVHRHDPKQILAQLQQVFEEQKPAGFLLDLQRPDVPLSGQIAALLTQELSCPVAVTAHYAKELSCPVFLEPPMDTPLQEYLGGWKGREIWLEAALEAVQIRVDTQGSRLEPADLTFLDEPVFQEPQLHCSYHIQINDDAVIFQLLRKKEDLSSLLEDAQKLGVTQAVGLYQQLSNILPL